MRQGSVVLADKNTTMLGGIRRLLEGEFETVLMVADEISLYHTLEDYIPDVVLADISLPLSAHTNIARELKKHFQDIKVHIFKQHLADHTIERS